MGGSHAHHPATGEETPSPVVGRGALVVLLVVLIPILIATAGAGVKLWPRGKPQTSALVVTTGAGGTIVGAEVRSTSAKACQGTSADRLPDGSIPATVTCASVIARITSGRDRGQDVTVAIPPQVYRAGIGPGQKIDLTLFPPVPGDTGIGSGSDLSGSDINSTTGDDEVVADPGAALAATGDATAPGDLGTLANGDVYAWADFSRGLPLGILAALFAVVVIAVARLRGLAALVGLALAGLAIGRFMLPALRLGENPVAVALVTSIAIMTVLLYLAHGVSAKTTIALLGTIFGLGLTAGLATWASSAAHLNGLGTEDNFTLSALTTRGDLSGVILCGIIIASLGVLNDVTITQTSAVWEVRAHAPHLPGRRLFSSGMRVGRDHLASTVYTIVFAYSGAALTTLLLIDIYQRPLGQTITSGAIAEEVARTLVGAIGLVLAIPVTTAITAAVLATSGRRSPGPDAVPLPSPTEAHA